MHLFLSLAVAALLTTTVTLPAADMWYTGSWKIDAAWVEEELKKDLDKDTKGNLDFAKGMVKLTYAFAPDSLEIKRGERGNTTAAQFVEDDKGYTQIRPLKDGKPTKYPPIVIKKSETGIVMQIRPLGNEPHVGGVDVPMVKAE